MNYDEMSINDCVLARNCIACIYSTVYMTKSIISILDVHYLLIEIQKEEYSISMNKLFANFFGKVMSKVHLIAMKY